MYNKIKWIAGILLVFFLIVATNLVDKHNFTRIQDSVVAIYEDRLVPKDLIFELSILIQEKEIAHMLSDSTFFANRNAIVDKEIEDILARYLDTKLTDKEERVFNKVQADLNRLMELESSIEEGQLNDNKVFVDQIVTLKEDLYKLSKIQLDEGIRQLSISKEVIEDVEVYTQIEIYLLAFLAVIIQIIVIYKPKESE